MDEYQYDELSMAMGFAFFSVGLNPPARPDSDKYFREDLRTIRPSMALKHFRFSGLPDSNSYDSHTGHIDYHSLEPEYIEESSHLERFQEENELGTDVDDLSEAPEGENEVIIDGNVYPDDEIVKLDLFQRARTGTVIFDGFSSNGQFEGFAPTPRSASNSFSVSDNNSSNTSRKSRSGKSNEGGVTSPRVQPTTPATVFPPTPPQSSVQSSSSPSQGKQIQFNTEQQHSQQQQASPVPDAPDRKAFARNLGMQLLGGIANRKEKVPLDEVEKGGADTITLDIDESTKVKKFVFPTNPNNTTPTTIRNNTNTPNTNTPNKTPTSNNATPNSIKSTTSTTNMVIKSPYDNTNNEDTWSPRTRELPPLPPSSTHSSVRNTHNLTPIVEGRESEDNTPAPTPFHMAGSL